MTRSGTWLEAWTDLFDYKRDPLGYMRREAREIARLRRIEVEAMTHHAEAYAYLHGGAWVSRGIDGEALSKLVDDLQHRLTACQDARVSLQGEFEYHVIGQSSHHDDRQILMRETLLRQGTAEEAGVGHVDGPSPLQAFLQQHVAGKPCERVVSAKSDCRMQRRRATRRR